jgi:hypothetical protein
MAYLMYVIGFVTLPPIRPVTSWNMNYALPILVGFMVIAIGDWLVRGRKTFEVPTAPIGHKGRGFVGGYG